MTTLDKIKNKIKNFNKKHNNLFYWISTWILILIGLFVFITMIIQTQWVGITQIQAPIIVWIIASPTIGVFFLPFILLLSYVCWFIIAVGKPITIKKAMNDCRSLYENEDIQKSEYETIYVEYEKADNRKTNQEKQELENLRKDVIKDENKEIH